MSTIAEIYGTKIRTMNGDELRRLRVYARLRSWYIIANLCAAEECRRAARFDAERRHQRDARMHI